MTAASAKAAVLAALVVHIQLLIAVVVIFIATAGMVIEIGGHVGMTLSACFVSFSVLECPAHALISFRCISLS